jgi:hypothetical protein
MRDAPRSNLPTAHVLGALRQPRRVQLHDPQVQNLLRRWKALGRPITPDEFAGLVDLLVPRGELRIQHIIKIRAAVVSAGIAICVDAPQPSPPEPVDTWYQDAEDEPWIRRARQLGSTC